MVMLGRGCLGGGEETRDLAGTQAGLRERGRLARVDGHQEYAGHEVHQTAGALDKLVGKDLELLLGSKLGAELQEGLFVVVGIVIYELIGEVLDAALEAVVGESQEEDEEAEGYQTKLGL